MPCVHTPAGPGPPHDGTVEPAAVDTALRRSALDRHGLLLREEAEALPVAQRRALVLVQPRVLAAPTTPLGPEAHLLAVVLSSPDVVLAGRTAAWRYGLTTPGAVVDVGLPAQRQRVLLEPARVRRLAPSLLRATRAVDGMRSVSVETAVVQSAEHAAADCVVAVVEAAVRGRLTTVDRLRTACRRGVAGSALLRLVLDDMADGAVDRWPRRLRRALEHAGITDLESEVRCTSSSGEVVYLDLLCRRAHRAVEVDGWESHGRRTAFVADRRRDRWLQQELSIATTRVAASELQRDLPGVVRELLPLLR